MKYLIVYDISSDRLRERVRGYLKDMGGERIQYSGFIFNCSEREIENIIKHIKKMVETRKAKIIAIPICKKDDEKTITMIYKYYIPEEDVVI